MGFNTTHEGEYVLLAIGRGEVGVDVMELPDDPDDLEEGISLQVSPRACFVQVFHEGVSLTADYER